MTQGRAARSYHVLHAAGPPTISCTMWFLSGCQAMGLGAIMSYLQQVSDHQLHHVVHERMRSNLVVGALGAGVCARAQG